MEADYWNMVSWVAIWSKLAFAVGKVTNIISSRLTPFLKRSWVMCRGIILTSRAITSLHTNITPFSLRSRQRYQSAFRCYPVPPLASSIFIALVSHSRLYQVLQCWLTSTSLNSLISSLVITIIMAAVSVQSWTSF